MNGATQRTDPLRQGVDFASELIVPGGSNLVEGDFKQGAIHAVLGLIAKSMFGLPGLIAVSANSFTKATTGRHLHEHLGIGAGPREPAPARPAPPAQRSAATKRPPASRRKKIT